MADELPELMSIREAAKALGVHSSTLRNWDRLGKLPAVRVGSRRDRKFNKEDVLAAAEGISPSDYAALEDLAALAASAVQNANTSTTASDLTRALRRLPAEQDALAWQKAAAEALRPIHELAKRFNDSFAQLNRDLFAQWHDQLNTHWADMIPNFDELLRPTLWEHTLLADRIADQLAALTTEPFAEYARLAATQAELSSMQAISTLAASFDAAGTAQVASMVSEQIRANIGAYQDFSRAALWDLNAADAIIDRRLPFAELKLAGGLLQSATSLVSELRVKPDDTPAATVRKPNLLQYFHRDAKQITGTEDLTDLELEAQLRAMKSFRAGNAGFAVVEAWTRANRTVQLSGQDPIFSPSVDAVAAAARLPLSFARSETELGDVVDGLYKLIFEASGDGKRVRAMTQPSQSEALENIVILRHFYRHDLAQGEADRNANRKFRRVGDVFQRLVGKSFPSSEVDWERACLELLRQAGTLLTNLADELERLG